MRARRSARRTITSAAPRGRTSRSPQGLAAAFAVGALVRSPASSRSPAAMHARRPRGTASYDPAVPRRSVALLVVVGALAMPASSSAMPGDPEFGPLTPADGAMLPVDPDAIAVSFTCPAYRVFDDGFIPVFGGASEYGVSLSASPALAPDGRLAGGTRNTGLRDTVTEGVCNAGLGAGGPPPRIQETPGTYYWQVYRICTGCPGGYEVSAVRSFTLVSPVKPSLTVPATAYDGYPFIVSVSLTGAPPGTGAAIERRAGSGWTRVATAGAAAGTAEAVVTLQRGQRALRAVATIGSQRLESSAKTVNVKRARNWSTSSRASGRYVSDTGLKGVTFRIAAKGRELRDFDAKVPMLCPGIVGGRFTTQVGTARLTRVKVAPDGRFVGAATPGGDTAIRLRGRLVGRKVTGARVELSLGTCSGSQGFSARRAGR